MQPYTASGKLPKPDLGARFTGPICIPCVSPGSMHLRVILEYLMWPSPPCRNRDLRVVSGMCSLPWPASIHLTFSLRTPITMVQRIGPYPTPRQSMHIFQGSQYSTRHRWHAVQAHKVHGFDFLTFLSPFWLSLPQAELSAKSTFCSSLLEGDYFWLIKISALYCMLHQSAWY